MARFNHMVLADPRTTCVMVPLRDGVTLVRRAS
jgi:predicted O-methyltransferase YrrM